MCPAAGVELFPPLPPGKTENNCEVSPVIISYSKTVLPSNLQKAQVSKQVQGRKSFEMPSCCLTDCPYHNKPATMESKPVRASTKSETKIDPQLQKSKAEPGWFGLPVSYRPKEGYVIDPELVPVRVRAGTVANTECPALQQK